MGLKCLIRYRGSSKAQIFKELKVQGWVWDLFCTRKRGRCSHQPAEETQGNTSVDSYHHKMNVLKSSEQLCNGGGESSNKTLGSGEALRETQMYTWNNNLSPGCTIPFQGIRKQVQGWLRLFNIPQCFYLSKARPLPIPQALSGTTSVSWKSCNVSHS